MSAILKMKLAKKIVSLGTFCRLAENVRKTRLSVVVVVFFWRLSLVQIERSDTDGSRFGCKEVKVVFVGSQLVWLGINAFLFVHFYMAFLVDRWFYTRVLLGVSPLHTFESSFVSF